MVEKCRYFHDCNFVNKQGYTCNHQEEAKHYCGVYIDGRMHESRCNGNCGNQCPEHQDYSWLK